MHEKEYGKLTKGMYIHIPFCVQKCLYCDFASWAGREHLQDTYVRKICSEITKRSEERQLSENATVYFGGGTPSLLTVLQLEKIIKQLKIDNLWRNPSEVTLELNPGTADLNKMKSYRELGVDRVSIGVQSFNDQELQMVGRIHTAKEALQAIEWAQEAGFQKINVDFIRGLPKQTVDSFENNLQRALLAGVEHISVYDLLVEDGTALSDLVENKKIVLPTEDEVDTMYELTLSILEAAGYSHYEISNFALPGKESQHNLVYWRYQPYIAFGSSACSFNGWQRQTNARTIESYLADLEPEIERISARQKLAEYLFMGLRTRWGISLSAVRKEFKVDLIKEFGKELEPYIKNEMLIYNEPKDQLCLTELGFKFSNRIFEIFL
ncbi:MAG TPA: radical SAM family heme chaperone HemW [Candidatus Avacidaminococcus intestinavium]|uniref:Heme chaperone HemW n=1 Tax=Candidatus Avacidaminococcus intestinavium TaxID=2840684 RepID=A0A9D1MNS4_9FIRM|nr:radical SAM family heme chaperone HemW [Candidatus Avacidaminococcus intestinavium]